MPNNKLLPYRADGVGSQLREGLAILRVRLTDTNASLLLSIRIKSYVERCSGALHQLAFIAIQASPGRP